MTKRLVVTVTGRVQMVMFRDFIKRRAQKLGLSGWVKNETSGNVTIVAEGEESKLQEILERAQKGSFLSRVDSVTSEWQESQGLSGIFFIQY